MYIKNFYSYIIDSTDALDGPSFHKPAAVDAAAGILQFYIVRQKETTA